ncbi:MAG: sensor histidine kinase, partial [Acinetobacter sp.]
MKMQLLEIGSETEQLSACKLSLLLGVFTPTNQVEHFLRFSRKMLGAQQAVLAFHNEPYIWYSSSRSFKAFCSPGETCLSPYFEGQAFIDHQHAQYLNLVQHVSHFGAEAKRYLAFDLRMSDGVSIGQVLFFDLQQDCFAPEDIATVQDFTNSLIHIIELKVDHGELKEMYEQQVALNFSKTKFFQIIAHDLRAPFHGLLGFSEVLAQ